MRFDHSNLLLDKLSKDNSLHRLYGCERWDGIKRKREREGRRKKRKERGKGEEGEREIGKEEDGGREREGGGREKR